jgi:hypothetical protein
MSRRAFLAAGAAGALGVVVATASPVVAPLLPAATFPSRRLTKSAFAAETGTAFRFRGASAAGAVLALADVQSLPHGPVDEHRFSLAFTGPSGRRLGQDTYSVDHKTLGRFDMFIVPVGPPGGTPVYEAVVDAGPVRR